jgi:hypothetical protein
MQVSQHNDTELVISDRLPENLWSSLLLAVMWRAFRFDKTKNTLTINHTLFSTTQVALSDIRELQVILDNDFEVSTYMMVWANLLLVDDRAIAISDKWAELEDMEKIIQAIVGCLNIKLSECKTLDLIIADLQLEIACEPKDPELHQELEDFLNKRAANTLDLIIDYLKLKISEDPDDLDLRQKLDKVLNKKV